MKSPLLVYGVGFLTLAVISGIVSASIQARWSSNASKGLSAQKSVECMTLATDPNPPINVRSSPIAASDNVVGRLPNGTQLKVIDEKQGWLRLDAPVKGWIAKNLTITTCADPDQPIAPSAASPATTSNRGFNWLKQAEEQYQSGNLPAAIALAQLVPVDSPAYPQARNDIVQWQQDWTTAATQFNEAQKAVEAKQWQTVLTIVNQFPDNRYWRMRLAPLVKTAIQQRSATAAQPGRSPQK